jgi:5-methylcytosine-specific restriction protein A
LISGDWTDWPSSKTSDGGPDHPKSVGAVCPTCHRLIHHGQGGPKLNAELQQYVLEIEQAQDSASAAE